MIPLLSTGCVTAKQAVTPRHHAFHGLYGMAHAGASVFGYVGMYLFRYGCMSSIVMRAFLSLLSHTCISPWSAWNKWNRGFVHKRFVKTRVKVQWKGRNSSMRLQNQSRFPKRLGRDKACNTCHKQAARLVMEDRVNAEASLARMQATHGDRLQVADDQA